MTPEAKARQTIDALLMQAGWHVCNMLDANIHAASGLGLDNIGSVLSCGCGGNAKSKRTQLLGWRYSMGEFG
jgi:hypothetical protein